MSIRILVLRRDDQFSARLREAGLDVENLELIRTEPVEDRSGINKLIGELDSYEGLFFTSPSAAEVFTEALKEAYRDYSGKIYVLGGRTKKLFELAGIGVEFDPDVSTAAGMIESFGYNEFAGKRLCLVRGDRTLGSIADRLADTAVLDEIVVYRTIETPPDNVTVDRLKKEIGNGDIAWACFFSPSALEVLEQTFGAMVARFKTAVIGPTTGQRAGQLGYDLAFVSPVSSGEAFAESLIKHLSE